MTVLIRIVMGADGTRTPDDGRYIQSMDFEFGMGRGLLTTTPSVEKAMKFSSASAAHEFWKTQSKIRPRRPDGHPNRPLTAYHVEILPISEAGH